MAKPKKSEERPRTAAFAKGGKTRMAGQGDHTTTALSDAAGVQEPGFTAHRTRDRGGRFAAGGAKVENGVGGLARRARAGECGT
jgi:hypothetical protein